MMIEVTFPNPPTIENWDNPTDWQTRQVEIDQSKIISLTNYKWGNKTGKRIEILTGHGGSEWHFLEQTLPEYEKYTLHPYSIDHPRQPKKP